MATGMSRDLQNAAQATKEQARAAVSDATDSVRSSLTQQKDGAASSLGSFAGALRKAAKESGGEGQGAGRMAEWAADGLERASSTLRSKDLNGMVREVESFARSQPVAFFFAAAAAGFLATRFLKAGTGPDSGGAGLSRTEPRPQDFPPSGAGIHPSDVSSDIPF
jgi:hypothetical protein